MIFVIAKTNGSFKVVNKTEKLYQSKFRSFVEKFQKAYETPDEEEKRYEIWKSNLDYIEKHNKDASLGQHEYFLKMNCYGDMVSLYNQSPLLTL